MHPSEAFKIIQNDGPFDFAIAEYRMPRTSRNRKGEEPIVDLFNQLRVNHIRLPFAILSDEFIDILKVHFRRQTEFVNKEQMFQNLTQLKPAIASMKSRYDTRRPSMGQDQRAMSNNPA